MANGEKYATRSMWHRAKFVLPMVGMILVTIKFGAALLVIVFKPEVAGPVAQMVPAVALAIGGMAAVGGAGVAAHDAFRERNGGGAA